MLIAILLLFAEVSLASNQTLLPNISATKLKSQDKIIIDGQMDEEAWQRSEVTDQFFQSEPDEGLPGTEKTRFRILYDKDNLYIFIEAFDSQPQSIVAKGMARDVAISGGDTVSVKLDSMDSKRNAFLFTTNPASIKIDAIIENNTSTRTAWDTIWDVEASVTEDGWFAEYAIPFRSISYNSDAQRWGLQINRIMSRTNERVRWASADRAVSLTDVAKYGNLAGINSINENRGIEAQLFASGTSNKTEQPTQDTESNIEVSGDFRYRITSKLTASATFNTDFSDTPLDSRQINTGRFSLFFPETRDFFLQDAAIFEFGGQVFHNNYFGDRNGVPFFSRNIGLVGGENPNLNAGVKLSGELGPINIGMLSARMAGTDMLNPQSLSTLRASTTLSDDTKFGLVATEGDPRGEIDQSLFGIDYQYRKAIESGGIFTVDSAFIQGTGNDQANGAFSGIAARFVNDDWVAFLNIRRFDQDYNPRLGFVNRTNIVAHDYMAWRFWYPKNQAIRQIDAGIQGTTNKVISGRGNDSWGAIFANVANPQGDQLGVTYRLSRADIASPFLIAGLLPVSADSYQYSQQSIIFSSARTRPIAFSLKVECCEIYDGDRLSTTTSFYYDPSAYFNLRISHISNQFKLPTGELDFHITNSTIGINFSPKLQFSIQVQHDSISDRLSLFGRLFYEIAPTLEGFVGIGHTAAIESENYSQGYEPLETGFAIRIGQTFRF